ncbi:hypothetical protein BDK51DRAFT_43074 [Blyttiomyces helicus]|uniref:t-SNARE coiled-coil homology domain-containing protein n=1 Tax=Blyttiomyces helicus TaxID=388810 RepID=A0A4P9WN27_9FUNG|nr:hypothetical protein BDK51DRAFT_43074 [Blyttiomyces helicus]|eukprot:RKO94334.1 hypothetical protein BDK51DRAFT_43074 [Blyttiomyces helicus]
MAGAMERSFVPFQSGSSREPSESARVWRSPAIGTATSSSSGRSSLVSCQEAGRSPQHAAPPCPSLRHDSPSHALAGHTIIRVLPPTTLPAITSATRSVAVAVTKDHFEREVFCDSLACRIQLGHNRLHSSHEMTLRVYEVGRTAVGLDVVRNLHTSDLPKQGQANGHQPACKVTSPLRETQPAQILGHRQHIRTLNKCHQNYPPNPQQQKNLTDHASATSRPAGNEIGTLESTKAPGAKPPRCKASPAPLTLRPIPRIRTRNSQSPNSQALFLSKKSVKTAERHGRVEADYQIDDVLDTLGNIKNIAHVMGNELEDQTRPLEDLDTRVDTTAGKLQLGMRRMKDFIKANAGELTNSSCDSPTSPKTHPPIRARASQSYTYPSPDPPPDTKQQ